MIEFILWNLVGLGLAWIAVDAWDPDDDSDDDDALDPIEPPTPTSDLLAAGGESLLGTDSGDLFLRDPDAADYVNVTIDAAEGDDTLALYDPASDGGGEYYETDFGFAEVDAGAGDDLIDIVSTYGTILGGDGDDTINLHSFAAGSEVHGEDGDDWLWGELQSGDHAVLDGGAGDDTIDASKMENVSAIGGDGDDLILVTGNNNSSSGYTVEAEGGDGDDTISYEGAALSDLAFPYADPLGLSGGDGADTFALTFNEGDAFSDDDLDQIPEGTESVALDVVGITDFEPGHDTIEVDASTQDDDYTIAEARLEEDTAAGTTQLILTYTHPTEIDRDLVVIISATGVTWDDIEFTDDIPLVGKDILLGTLEFEIQTANGTSQDDLFLRDRSAEYWYVDLEAGDGDDTIALYDPATDSTGEFQDAIGGGTFDLGAGDDLLDAVEGVVYCGDGDDTVHLHEFAASSRVYGDAGDDSIRAESQATYGAELYGGEGNDTLDARDIENVGASGGDGDDTILVSRRPFGGSGYTVSVGGGDGDDTIHFEGLHESDVNEEGMFNIIANGGEGADLFVLDITEGGEDMSESSLPPGTETTTVYLMEIRDFDPAEDRIEIDAATLNNEYTMTEARLEEDTDAGKTQLIISYDHPTEINRDMVVTINGTGLTWDDITFVGEELPAA